MDVCPLSVIHLCLSRTSYSVSRGKQSCQLCFKSPCKCYCFVKIDIKWRHQTCSDGTRHNHQSILHVYLACTTWSACTTTKITPKQKHFCRALLIYVSLVLESRNQEVPDTGGVLVYMKCLAWELSMKLLKILLKHAYDQNSMKSQVGKHGRLAALGKGNNEKHAQRWDGKDWSYRKVSLRCGQFHCFPKQDHFL